MSGLLALCGLALLAQHVAELGSNYHGDHLVAGALMLMLAVIVWFPRPNPTRSSCGFCQEYRQWKNTN